MNIPEGKRVNQFYECGCCNCFHRDDFWGDCREDSERYSDIPEGAIEIRYDEDPIEDQEWRKWKAASGGKRGWHIIRFIDGPGITGENYKTKNGRLWTCKNSKTAFKKAKELNANR